MRDLRTQSPIGEKQTQNSLQKSVTKAMMAELRAAGDMAPLQDAAGMLHKSHFRPHPKGWSVLLLARPLRRTGAETSFLVSKISSNPA